MTMESPKKIVENKNGQGKNRKKWETRMKESFPKAFEGSSAAIDACVEERARLVRRALPGFRVQG